MLANVIRPFLIIITALMLGGAAYYLWQEVPGEKSEAQSVIPLSAENLYPYFTDVQKLDMWLPFAERKAFSKVNFYWPYMGPGASLEYFGKEKNSELEITVRRNAENRYVQYALLAPDDKRPTNVTAYLKQTAPNQTTITWRIVTPPSRRLDHLISSVGNSDLEDRLAASGTLLSNIIAGSIQEQNYLKNIQFDSLYTENISPTVYVGTNASSGAKPDNFSASIQLNGNKVRNFASIDLQLKPTEFGKVTVFVPSYSGRGPQVTYFAGVAVKKKVTSNDQNFMIVEKGDGAAWSKFYKGKMEGVPAVLSELSHAVTKAGRKTREYQLIFIQNPQKGQPLLIKISAIAE